MQCISVGIPIISLDSALNHKSQSDDYKWIAMSKWPQLAHANNQYLSGWLLNLPTQISFEHSPRTTFSQPVYPNLIHFCLTYIFQNVALVFSVLWCSTFIMKEWKYAKSCWRNSKFHISLFFEYCKRRFALCLLIFKCLFHNKISRVLLSFWEISAFGFRFSNFVCMPWIWS